MSLKRKNKTLGKLLTQLGCLTPAFHLPEWQNPHPHSTPTHTHTRPYLTSSEIPTSASSLLPRTPVSLLWKQTSLRQGLRGARSWLANLCNRLWAERRSQRKWRLDREAPDPAEAPCSAGSAPATPTHTGCRNTAAVPATTHYTATL